MGGLLHIPRSDATARNAWRAFPKATPLPPPASNRLTGITLATGYEGAGNVITDSRGAGYSTTYDTAGRMAAMLINPVLQGSDKYDFAGRQAIRTIASTSVKGPFGV